ncbi:MAG: hypothetical protein KAR87_02940 [Candidatus Aenigmarchaeota archaeon]|nr:hypothetical protein [Candidatus Aenigmarchaeota archaeon]MCK5176573.1 hypothetical protein [Candidatus Aenigmarchaeota archaeon]
MKSHDFDRIIVPVYLVCILFSVICWIRYGSTGLTISFLIFFLPLALSTKQHYAGSRENGVDTLGMYHDSTLFRLIEKSKKYYR